MPSKSKSQQRLFGLVHAIQKGEMDPKDASPEAREMAKKMKKSDVEDFAKTAHKGLPVKVKEECSSSKKKHKKIRESIRQMVAEEMKNLNEVSELLSKCLVTWEGQTLVFSRNGRPLFDLSEKDALRLLDFLKKSKFYH